MNESLSCHTLENAIFIYLTLVSLIQQFLEDYFLFKNFIFVNCGVESFLHRKLFKTRNLANLMLDDANNILLDLQTPINFVEFFKLP